MTFYEALYNLPAKAIIVNRDVLIEGEYLYYRNVKQLMLHNPYETDKIFIPTRKQIASTWWHICTQFT